MPKKRPSKSSLNNFHLIKSPFITLCALVILSNHNINPPIAWNSLYALGYTVRLHQLTWGHDWVFMQAALVMHACRLPRLLWLICNLFLIIRQLFYYNIFMIGRVNPSLILMNRLVFILLDYFLIFIKVSTKLWIFFMVIKSVPIHDLSAA